MSQRIIKTDDSSFVIKSIMPSDWDKSAGLTIDIIDLSGTKIVDGGAVTLYAGDTTSAAADAGDESIVLTTGNALNAGDAVAIGSDAQGWQEMVVDDYTAATKTVVFTKLLQEDLVSGSSVVGLDMSYAVDASVSGFDDVSQVSVLWIPDTDDLPMTELWDVQSRQTQQAGVEHEFATAYPHFYSSPGNDDFMRFHDRAYSILEQHFETRGRDFTLVVDSPALKEVLLTQIAVLIAMGSTVSTEEWERLNQHLDKQLTLLDNLPIWIDEDEDSIKDEDEDQKVVFGSLRRGI